MTKPLSGIHPIATRETFYQLTSHVLCLQFYDTFATHLSLYQFKVTTKCDCEMVIHGIKCTLDLHPNWVVRELDVVNAFNLISQWSHLPWELVKMIFWEGHYFSNPL
jgi:hypothetical protein